MVSHIKAIAYLHIILGALGILAGIAILVFFGAIAGFIGLSADNSGDAQAAAPILAIIGWCICLLLAVLSVPGLIAGIGLLRWKPWARVLTIVLSVLQVLNFPIGTAIGVYSLWALLSPEGELLFRSYGQPGAVAPMQGPVKPAL